MILQRNNSGLYVPFIKHNDRTQADLLDEYRKQHECCPMCRSNETEQTCLGSMITPPWQEYVSPNDATCIACGWSGKVHDLTPERTANGANNDAT